MTAVILVAIGLGLAIYGLMGIKKEQSTFSSIIESEMTSHNKENREINILRKEIAESILDLQKEIFQMQDDINYIKKEGKSIPFEENNKEYTKELKSKSDNTKVESKDKIDVRSLVIKMLSEGKTIDEISSSLGIGRGEILLIQDLSSK